MAAARSCCGTAGTWEPADPDPMAAYAKGTLKFALQGEKLHGDWVLVRMRGRKKADEGQRELAADQGARRSGSAGQRRCRRRATSRSASRAAGRSMKSPPIATGSGTRSTRRQRAERPAASTGCAETARARPRSAARARAQMPEQPKPQLASLAQHAPDGDDWLHEIKYDGYRLLARIEQRQGPADHPRRP